MLKLAEPPIARGDLDVPEIRELITAANIRSIYDFDPRNDDHVNAAIALLIAGPELIDVYEAYLAQRRRREAEEQASCA